MKVVGTKIEKANTSEKSIEAFYNSDYLAELGFDFETIWTANETAFPVLHYEAAAKNVFRVKTLHYDSNERTLTVSFPHQLPRCGKLYSLSRRLQQPRQDG